MNLDKVFGYLNSISAKITVLIILMFFIILIYNITPLLNTIGLTKIFTNDWAPNIGKFGGLASIIGTLLTTFLSMIISIPFAIGMAIFFTSIIDSKYSFLSIFIDFLAIIPSVIYGMWGIFYFVPFMSKLTDSSGLGLLTASIIIALMVLPFMSSLIKNAIQTVPVILCESAYALGATRLNLIKDIVFPHIKNMIYGSIILAFSRAIGETMAVAFVLGGIQELPNNIISPTTSIPVTLTNEFAEASKGDFRSSLYYLAFILLAISTAVIIFSRFITLKNSKD